MIYSTPSNKGKSLKNFRFSKKFKSSKKKKERIIALIKPKYHPNFTLSKETIDPKNVVLLRKCITAEGKILPRRVTGLNAKQQRHIAKAIKNSRIIGLLPFINISK